MRALQFSQPERRLEVHEVPWPTASAPNDVVVRVSYAGVCGTDLHALYDTFPVSQDWLTMGHELSGVVAEVGSGVTTVSVGDRVAVDPNKGCGSCEFCKLGQVNFCPRGGISDTLGFWRPGGWAAATVAPEHSVHRLPDGLPLCSAVLCEPLSCLIHALDQFEPVPTQGRVLILGAGIIGVLVACMLHHRGARNVTVSEPAAARRAVVDALDLGFRTVTPDQLAAEFAPLTERQLAAGGLDMVIDCSGVCSAIETAAGWLRMGGRLCLFGVPSAQERVALSPYLLVTREITVRGILINPHTFPRATALAAELYPRYLRPEKVGVQLFTLEEYPQALEKLKSGQICKAVFMLDGSQE
ncbi:D-arabinitol dehydrogenase 1-like [Pollicipes pollicipes]|uniref:D-arabinitol dehydrogenase 1-like n=1 Tax=Pollicipes pollicipes TaxID=41117 RepID=UPI001884C4D0|nr:D-arabinitol dehydrogenase 1-like [Pollicipes pollicipes]